MPIDPTRVGAATHPYAVSWDSRDSGTGFVISLDDGTAVVFDGTLTITSDVVEPA